MSDPQNNETIMYRLGALEMSVGTLSEKLDTLTKPLIELCTQQRFQIDAVGQRVDDGRHPPLETARENTFKLKGASR